MTLDEIKIYIKSHEIHDAVKYFLFRDVIPAISSKNRYDEYKYIVANDHPKASSILIGGSGNWGFSFNPKKLYRPFCDESDIDLVVVSEHYFHDLWEKMRRFHRENWYRIGKENQLSLRRNGENVYSGFITPKWVNDCTFKYRIEYQEKVNNYSNDIVGYKEVNLMYFKNEIELIDYYVRSFRIVRKD